MEEIHWEGQNFSEVVAPQEEEEEEEEEEEGGGGGLLLLLLLLGKGLIYEAYFYIHFSTY